MIAALAAACFTMSAQNKGDMAVGGVIGLSGGSATISYSNNGTTSSDKSSSPTLFEFSPEFSYFVIDNLELSAGLNYTLQSEHIGDDGDRKLYMNSNIAMFTIGANYYIPLVDGILYYTPGVKFGFGGGSNVIQTSADRTVNTKIPFAFGFDAELGTIEFKPLDFLGVSLNFLDLSVTYATTGEGNGKTATTNFAAGFNYGMSAGVKYYF